MNKEYIEMATTWGNIDVNSSPTSSSPGTSTYFSTATEKNPTISKKMVQKRSYHLKPVTTRSMSYCWVLCPVLCYVGVMVGGIMSSVGVGTVYAAFDDLCILNANFTLRISISPNGNKSLDFYHTNEWGRKGDCLFAEYGSVALVIFSGVWIVMVLQCGRGGASRRGFRLPDAWRIVPPTFVINMTFFIISCIILNEITAGFMSFCENSNVIIAPNNTNYDASCMEILGYNLTKYKHVDLVEQSRMAGIGATIEFIGCLLGFIIVILRCCSGPDFDLYQSRVIEYTLANADEERQCEAIQEEDEAYDDDNFEDCDENGQFKVTTAILFCHPPPAPVTEPPYQINAADESDGSVTSKTALILN